MFKRITSVVYIVALLTLTVCLPLFAILVTVKLCGATGMPWIGCCVPLVVSFAVLPLMVISKFFIDQNTK